MSIIHKYTKDVPIFKARILNSDDSQFYKEVLQKAKIDFPHAYPYISKNINPENAEGSNFLFVCLLDEMLGKSGRIPTDEDWAQMLNGGNFAKGVYFDANQLILRSNSASYNQNQYLINDISRKLKGEKIKGAPIEYSSENPLKITGAKLRKSTAQNNEYKLILNLNDAIPEYDARHAFGKNQINLGNHTKNLYTKAEGLSRLYLYENDVDSDDGNLAFSNSDGRVAIIDN